MGPAGVCTHRVHADRKKYAHSLVSGQNVGNKSGSMRCLKLAHILFKWIEIIIHATVIHVLARCRIWTLWRTFRPFDHHQKHPCVTICAIFLHTLGEVHLWPKIDANTHGYPCSLLSALVGYLNSPTTACLVTFSYICGSLKHIVHFFVPAGHFFLDF